MVAIASGKGGVGKSTVAVNLACALSRLGAKVGLLDCDIYGPSIPLMMGTSQKPAISEQEMMVPPVQYGVKLMSIGFLIDGDQPVIWRGPMIMKTIQQFIGSVDWGELDYLLVDLPPGTGDAQLSLSQVLPLGGVVMVTTPQDVALLDVRKAIGMFQRLNVPILGIVENMSTFACPHCGQATAIFGDAGGQRLADEYNVPLLARLPLDPETRVGGDEGSPITVRRPDSAPARAFRDLARSVSQRLDTLGQLGTLPKIS